MSDKPRDVLLLEPNYKNKYPPMGLMKLASYYRKNGDNVRFFKGDMKIFASELFYEAFISFLEERYINEELYLSLANCSFYEEASYEKSFSSDEYIHNIWNKQISYVLNAKKEKHNIMKYIQTGKVSCFDKIKKLFPSTLDADVISKVKEYRDRFKVSDYIKFDVICITTLFTFHWDTTIETIKVAKDMCKNWQEHLHVGGIMATILYDKIVDATSVKVHKGLLSKHGVLDAGNTDIIDEMPLDYSILDEIDYKYPAKEAYFSYCTRGCNNKCSFCAVRILEPDFCSYVSIKKQIEETTKRFGEQRNLLLLDNNVLYSKDFNKIIDEIKECGFAKDQKFVKTLENSPYFVAIKNLKENYNVPAQIKKILSIYDKFQENKLSKNDVTTMSGLREKYNCVEYQTATKEDVLKIDDFFSSIYKKKFKENSIVRYVDFNQGTDARLFTPEKVAKLAEINIKPLRIAFDHIEQTDAYVKAVKMASGEQIKHFSNYLLYNFEDKPEDLYERMKINVDLCEELGISIYSFPMRYHPINDKEEHFKTRTFIGRNWNRKFIYAIQAVLGATQGKIGRGKSFFEEAFGKNKEEFFKILWMPKELIINRMANKEGATAKWWNKFSMLNKKDSKIVKEILEDTGGHVKDIDLDKYNKNIQEVLGYYNLDKDSYKVILNSKRRHRMPITTIII